VRRVVLDFGLVCSLRDRPLQPAELLERAHGEFGLDHVTASAVAGAGQAVYLGERDGPREFCCEPGWQYPPDPACYERCELRPRAARGVGRRNGLAELAGSAALLGIRLFIRLDLRAALLGLGSAAHLAMRNAWGEPLPGGGPCVSQPAVRELLRATLLELAGCKPGGFQIVGWWPDRPALAGGERPVRWNPPARFLLDVCFCDACRQIAAAAGVDPDQAARSTQVHFRSALAADSPRDWLRKLQWDQVLTAYLHSRREESRRWLASLKPAGSSYLLMLVGEIPTAIRIRSTMQDRSGREPEWDAAVWWAPPEAPEGWGLLGRPLFAAGGGPSAATAGEALSLPAWRPAFRDSSELVRFVQDALEGGVRFFDFEGLDLNPPEALTWVRQAVRYARRSPLGERGLGQADARSQI
jgi:hypothetical protein